MHAVDLSFRILKICVGTDQMPWNGPPRPNSCIVIVFCLRICGRSLNKVPMYLWQELDHVRRILLICGPACPQHTCCGFKVDNVKGPREIVEDGESSQWRRGGL